MMRNTRHIGVKQIMLLSIMNFIMISCTCDCLPPCDEEMQLISVVKQESFEWFEFYENSNENRFTNRLITQRYFSDDDSYIIIDNTDTTEILTQVIFKEDAQCIEGCPSICERIEGVFAGHFDEWKMIPQVNMSSGAFHEEGDISYELISPDPHNKSYRFSLANTGEIKDDIHVLRIERVQNQINYSAVDQEEIDRVSLLHLEDFSLDGITYNQCYELLDSILLGPGSFSSFRCIFNKENGPIFFEHHNSSYFPELDKTQFNLQTIKKHN